MLDFLAYLEFERGLSRNTLEAYRSDLLQYGAYLDTAATRSRSRTPTSPAFVAALAAGDGEKPPVAPATLQRKVACLRSFYRHLRRQGMLEADPTAQPARAQAEPAPAAGAQRATRSPSCSSSRAAPSRPRCATARCWS